MKTILAACSGALLFTVSTASAQEKAGPRVHITGGEGTGVALSALDPDGRPLRCFVPCDKPVARRSPMHFTGEDIPSSEDFEVDGDGIVRVEVIPGNMGRRRIGIGLLATGGLTALVGGIFLGAGLKNDNRDAGMPMVIGGGAVLGVTLVVAVVGGVLMETSRTKFKMLDHVEARSGGFALRF